MRDSWRDRARPIIAAVIDRVGKGDLKKLKAALREAYPFGLRQYMPYKVWLDEIRRQIKGRRPFEREPVKPADGQKVLFTQGDER